jgi:hypothetical protein
MYSICLQCICQEVAGRKLNLPAKCMYSHCSQCICQKAAGKKLAPDSSRLLELKPVSSCRGRPTPAGAGGSKGSGTHQRSACTQIARSASAIQPCAVTFLTCLPCICQEAAERNYPRQRSACTQIACKATDRRTLERDCTCQRRSRSRYACNASARKSLKGTNLASAVYVLKLLAMHLQEV